MKLLILTLILSSTQLFAKMERVVDFGENPGNLTMYKVVPHSAKGRVPLVVALHGCTQTAAEFDQRSGWSHLAEKAGFLMLYPEQQSGNNAMMCFNWGAPTGRVNNLIRGEGENHSIAQMINHMKENYNIGDIYITGFSAGGALSANMLSLYPDLFKAGAIMAGIPFGCANDLLSSFSCMFQGKTFTSQEWGDFVRGAFQYNGRYPKVSIWHGSSDYTVTPNNALELVKQWTNIHGISVEGVREDLGDQNEHFVFTNDSGEKLLYFHHIIGMGHAITVDPSEDRSGGSTGAFSENKGIHSTYQTAVEWGIL